jgi:hypothetical protein
MAMQVISCALDIHVERLSWRLLRKRLAAGNRRRAVYALLPDRCIFVLPAFKVKAGPEDKAHSTCRVFGTLRAAYSAAPRVPGCQSGGMSSYGLACIALCFSASVCEATDLRGRIETRSREAVTIELRSPRSPHATVRKAQPDRDGRFYMADIPPGPYELVVNGRRFSIAVEQVAIQELPPIPLKS